MRLFRNISVLLTLTGIGLFLFDLAYGWIVNAKLKIRNVEELWTDVNKSSFEHVKIAGESVFPFDKWESFVHLPAPAVILVFAVIFYLIYRILFSLSGGKSRERR